jgi:hypothetical protein
MDIVRECAGWTGDACGVISVWGSKRAESATSLKIEGHKVHAWCHWSTEGWPRQIEMLTNPVITRQLPESVTTSLGILCILSMLYFPFNSGLLP